MIAAWMAPDADAEEIGGDLDFFHPSPHGHDDLTFPLMTMLKPGTYRVGGFADFEAPVLEVFRPEDGGTGRYKYVSARLTTEAHGSVGLTPDFEFGAAIPYVLVNTGDDENLGTSLADRGLGDIRAHLKYSLDGQGSLRMGLSGVVTMPTGSPESLFGAAGPTLRPQFVTQLGGTGDSLIATAGAVLRAEETLGPVRAGTELTLGVGLRTRVGNEGTVAGLELRAAAPLTDPLAEALRTPLEVDGVGVYRWGAFRIRVGAGLGVFGYSVPRPRLFAGVEWDPDQQLFGGAPDEDEDGVPDDIDRCPRNPEIL